MLHGIDVSSWQGAIDVSQIPVDFVISKATEGTYYINPCCDDVIQTARECGLKWGFYHFADAENPIAEANYFVDNCKGYFKEGVPVLDFEGSSVYEWGVEGAKAFLDRVSELTWIRPLIYMSENVCTQFDWARVAEDYGLWVASYPDVASPSFEDAENMGVNLNVGAWECAALWQFASDGLLNGYNGFLDVNLAFMDRDAWDKYAGKTVTAEFADVAHESNVETFETENYRITVETK